MSFKRTVRHIAAMLFYCSHLLILLFEGVQNRPSNSEAKMPSKQDFCKLCALVVLVCTDGLMHFERNGISSGMSSVHNTEGNQDRTYNQAYRPVLPDETQPRRILHNYTARDSSSENCDCLNGGWCQDDGVCDCTQLQALGDRCQIVPNQGRDRDGICRSWGQHHYETFDGIYFYFPGTCSYVLAQDCHSATPQYTVWVHNSRVCNGNLYSCPRALSLLFPNEEEIHISAYHVNQGGHRLNLPHTIGGVFIERLADYLLVKSVFGFSLAWDGGTGVYLKLSEEHQGTSCGLCGNFNHIPGDDLTTVSGIRTNEPAVFANSWAVDLPHERVCPSVDLDFSGPCDSESDMDDAIEKCSALLFFPFLSCHENIDPNPFVASCVSDLCVADDEETFCRALVEYTRACSHVGYPVREWRDSFPSCNDGCKQSFVYRDCISCCPPTCTFEKECLGTNLHCLDGCYCPDGLILQNGKCIPASECPCVYHGSSYVHGHVLQEGCNVCNCVGGIWNCTENNCTAECSVVGDVFVTTFDGRMFLQPGACQYVLAKSRGSSRFTVTLQYTTCTEQQVCIQSVTLVLEEDVSRQITLTREGGVMIGVNSAPILPYSDDVMDVRKLTSVFTQLKARLGLRLHYDGKGGRVHLQLESQWRGLTLGLCGTLNGNLRDDFLSPAGMIEGTPQLHANAWKVSSTCVAPVNMPIVDPCEINLQYVFYASKCEVLLGSVFAQCHSYISPNIYRQQCRYQACRCGSPCLCTALAHYALLCSKHGVDINFRAHVSECGVVCLGGMLYHSCASSCGRSCRSLSSMEICNPDDCAEGCGCPDGSYYDDMRQRCVRLAQCHCYSMTGVSQPGEVVFSATGPCLCKNGKLECVPEEKEPDSPKIEQCPGYKVYHSCAEQRGGVACAPTCRNLMLNVTCPPSTPCIPGCVCPPGLVLHRGECYYPENCPCVWLGLEYLPGETVETSCSKCVCHRGYFNCSYSPCPAVCTIYSDRHYHTFDGLEYDYHSDCQVYLLKSSRETEVSIVAQNKDCYESSIVCMKTLVIHVGLTKIYFKDNSGNPSPSTVVGRESVFELWKAGFYTVVHFPDQDLTILWDRKTTVHVRAGPRWKGLLGGLCGNFDSVTINDMTTSNNMEVNNAQTFGDSWALGQCQSDYVVERPCEADLGRQPYAKQECALLYSDVFASCHNVVDVAWFYRNCLTDTCNCDRGGDCECLCTSIAAYANKCCQQGITVHWRSPSVCPQDCEYYNQALGDGPYSLVSAVHNNTMIGVNRTSGSVFPLSRDTPGRGPAPGLLFNFMVTPGLHKNKTSRVPVVSLESAERPNFFLVVSRKRCVQLEHWSQGEDFRQRATFIQHRGLFLPGHSSFEVASQPGVFLTLTRTAARALRYDSSVGFKASSSFILEETHFVIPYRMMCEWRYLACASPCVRTCSDPHATHCTFLPLVEGCFPRCPQNMVLDEITSRCVYLEDCVTLPPSPTPFAFVTRPNITRSPPTTLSTTRHASTTPRTSTTTVLAMSSTTMKLSTVATTPSPFPPSVPTTTTPPIRMPTKLPSTTPTEPFTSLPIFTPTPSVTLTTVDPTIKAVPSVPLTSTSFPIISLGTTATPPQPDPADTAAITLADPPTVAVATSATIDTSTEPAITEILTSQDTFPTKEASTPSPLFIPTTPCTPPYVLRIDKCAELICLNGQLLLYNASLYCRLNTTRPQCSLLGLPVLINMDPCCPQWRCPCRCTVMSDLRMITFDGNNVALYDNGAYMLVNLPGETIIGSVEKCPTSQSVNSIRRPSGTGGTSGLCLKKLNITISSDRVIINRLDRKITVNYRSTRLPFSLHSLRIEDTGSMYLIKTPGQISIQWYHSTGIMVLQYSMPNEASVLTQGLCGSCDGNPDNDLRLPNGTIVREVRDMVLYLQAWRVPMPDESEHTRRVGDNCSIGDCSICLYMLHQRAFTPCHSKVPPNQFCDIMWAGDRHYKDHQCDFLAAYVAVCYTHQVCVSWRRHNFCPFRCPPGKEYHPCVNTCTSLTCLNRDYYEETTCPFVREACVCRSRTLLHRADSPHCVTEDRCVCTDNEGRPRAPGEVWNGSTQSCCLYKCMENGSVIAVEPDCGFTPTPMCERHGEYVLDVLEEGACCPKKICDCNMTICDSEAPACDEGDRLVIGYSSLSCCPEYRCECDPAACPSVPSPSCGEDQFLVEIREEKLCCFSYLCVCESCMEPVPVCSHAEILAVVLNTTNSCCPRYHCVCDVNQCPESSVVCAPGLALVETTLPGYCCPQKHCECRCEDSALQVCQLGEALFEVPDISSSDCACSRHLCQKAEVCLFQGLTVLGPGQSLVQYFEVDMCSTVHCLHHKDPNTGFYAMEIASVNCSQQCEPNQLYISSTDPQVCCGSCKNISCIFPNHNGTTDLFAVGSSWVENCTRYDCLETVVGAVVLASSVVCPPFNDTQCIQNGGVVQTYEDGCCRTCAGVGVLPFTVNPVTPTGSTNCDTGKEDGKTCKRVAIRTTIRKDDCRSHTPVTVFSCDGKCPSATIFNFNINSHARFCKCCRENGLQSRTVVLYCTRNATAVEYGFQEPLDCTCQWN